MGALPYGKTPDAAMQGHGRFPKNHPGTPNDHVREAQASTAIQTRKIPTRCTMSRRSCAHKVPLRCMAVSKRVATTDSRLSETPCEEQNDDNDQNDSESTDATVSEAVAIATESATEATK
jgi:hypothetical protein